MDRKENRLSEIVRIPFPTEVIRDEGSDLGSGTVSRVTELGCMLRRVRAEAEAEAAAESEAERILSGKG